MLSTSVTSRCIVEENGNRRTFTVTVEPLSFQSVQTELIAKKETFSSQVEESKLSSLFEGVKIEIYSGFSGLVEIVDILVKPGDRVSKGQTVAAVEAMKAKHDIKAHDDGVVEKVLAKIGDEIDVHEPILIIIKEKS